MAPRGSSLLRTAVTTLPSTSHASTSSATACSASTRRCLSTSAHVRRREATEWSYPSQLGDERPRRPFLNPEVSKHIPNLVAIRNEMAPYPLPSTLLDPYQTPPTLPLPEIPVHTHTVTFQSYNDRDLLPRYASLLGHTCLALQLAMKPVQVKQRVKTERWAMPRSPHAASKTKDVWERVTLERKFEIYNCAPEAMEKIVRVILALGGTNESDGVVFKVDAFDHIASPTSDSIAAKNNQQQQLASVRPLSKDGKQEVILQIAEKFIEEQRQLLKTKTAEKEKAKADMIKSLKLTRRELDAPAEDPRSISAVDKQQPPRIVEVEAQIERAETQLHSAVEKLPKAVETRYVAIPEPADVPPVELSPPAPTVVDETLSAINNATQSAIEDIQQARKEVSPTESAKQDVKEAQSSDVVPKQQTSTANVEAVVLNDDLNTAKVASEGVNAASGREDEALLKGVEKAAKQDEQKEK